MATQSSILAREVPWTEAPGRLQSTGSQRAGPDWATALALSHFVLRHLEAPFLFFQAQSLFIVYFVQNICLRANKLVPYYWKLQTETEKPQQIILDFSQKENREPGSFHGACLHSEWCSVENVYFETSTWSPEDSPGSVLENTLKPWGAHWNSLETYVLHNE